MILRALALAGLAASAGWALVLAEVPWFRRRPLVQRIAPYMAGGGGTRQAAPLRTASTWRELIEPLARQLGARIASLFGVVEPLSRRLRRVHSPMTVTEFRMRQMAWAGGGLGVGTTLALALGLVGPVALAFVGGGPLLGFLLVEQSLARESDRWKRRLALELPVVAEQLGMLLGAGYSLSAALHRLAERGRGVCARDLARVCARVEVGLEEGAALREWADVADVPAVHRLVSVLTLNSKAGDLGRLTSDEARAMRRELHRQVLATMDRRGQQVWVPVTVATLVPGVIFLAIPFVEALRLFSRA
jgi:tight adherence protein C